MTTFVGCTEFTLYCPGAFSLKDKRQSIQSLLDQIRDNWNLAAAEVGHQDQHRLSKVAFSTVSSSKQNIQTVFDNLEQKISDNPEIQIREIEQTLV
ncbi:MAG: DUF503 domain-containing protein [bacterium]